MTEASRSLEVAVIQISSVHSKTGRKQEVVADQRGRKWEGLYCTSVSSPHVYGHENIREYRATRGRGMANRLVDLAAGQLYPEDAPCPLAVEGDGNCH